MTRHKMTRHKILLSLLAATLMVSAARAEEYSHVRIVRLSLVEGDVQVMNAPGANWEKAIVNLPVREGMSFATGQGRAEIEFENGSTARIADNTVLQFTELALSGGEKVTRLDISQGTATLYTNPTRRETFVVHAGKLEMTVRENSHFRVDVFEDGASVSVLKGNVEVATVGGPERVAKGQTLAVRNNAPDQIAIERNPAPDEWDRWVSSRDNAIYTGRADSMRFVNSPLSYGLSDLSYYGGWQNCSGFGNCWQPHGVGAGWSPFYNGSWGFVPGLGFTWVSYEPWGWMPYHYGRWAFSPIYGWVWVPGYFNGFNPGAVYWCHTARGLGWVPQSPRDVTGGTPQNLPHGVITNTATGLATGLPNKLGNLPVGETPRFFTDTRNDAEMVRAGQQIQATAASRAAQNPAQASLAVGAMPGTPRKMSVREGAASPARVYTVVPAAPANASSQSGGHAAPSSSSSAPRPAPSSSAPKPASAPRSAPSPAPATHSLPQSHPSSSRPPASHPR
jgi:hypothetical protein